MAGGDVRTNQEPQPMIGAALAELMAAVVGKGKPFRFTAPGHSMAPFIRDGDAVTIAPERVRLGDVVAFVGSDSGKLTVHRVVRMTRDGYLVKGDNAAEHFGLGHRAIADALDRELAAAAGDAPEPALR